MRLTRRSAATDEGMFPELVDVLLDGWACPIKPEHHADPFRIFTMSDDEMRAAWFRARPALMKEWHRRGGIGQPWAVRRFEEDR